jgi:hypothetical protein
MGVSQGIADMGSNGERVFHGKATIRRDHLLHVRALDIFHDEVEEPLGGLAGVINRNDSGMGKASHCLRLALEPLGLRLGRDFGYGHPSSAKSSPKIPQQPLSTTPVEIKQIDERKATQPSTEADVTAGATVISPFVNSLGMKFVPVPITGGPTSGQRVLFCIWETRVRDYQAFLQENPRKWFKPEFEQGPTHPVPWVSWDDAQAFCSWLTAREQKSGSIPKNQRYRLPSDHEWSCAVGIGDREDPMKLPADKSGKITDVFPWAKGWPPARGAGNYSGEEAVGHETSKEQGIIKGFRDEFAGTSPVGSFAANKFGLFDLGGNAWEWCQDWFEGEHQRRVARGASFDYDTRGTLLSSYRGRAKPDYIGFGFRCVLSADVLETIPAESARVVAVKSIAEILTSPDYEWSKPENLGQGLNSAMDEYAMGISDDGLVLVLSSTRDGAEHLFECRRASVDQQFAKAVPLNELKSSTQSGPFLSGDGLTLLYGFRPNATAAMDICETHRTSREASWEKPAHIHLLPNASSNGGPCLSTDGLTMWFNSNRTGGRGGFDLWRSSRPSLASPFSEPVNLGDKVNTDMDELSPRMTGDNRTLLFYRERHGTGQRLYFAIADENGTFTTRPLLFSVNGRVQSPTLSTDGRILYFASDMPGGQGGWDLWQIRRVLKN